MASLPIGQDGDLKREPDAPRRGESGAAVGATNGARDDGSGASSRQHALHAINQRIFETSIDLILVVDRRGSFIRISPSSMAILGYQPDEMVGHSAAEFLHYEDLDNTRNEMRMARHGKSMRNFECRYVHKQGRIVSLGWTGVWSEPEGQY